MGAIALGCLSLSACGGRPSDDTASIRERVRDYLPEARTINCKRRAPGAHCDVLVGRPPGGLEAWTCEFTFAYGADRAAYSRTESCWSDGGTASHLHMPSD